MLQRHGHSESGDGDEPVLVHLLDKGGHQGAGGAHKQADKAGDRRSNKYPAPAQCHGGQSGAPAQIKHEQGNGQLPDPGWQGHQ